MGYILSGEPQLVRSMPWSTVMCFQTSQGKVYLKTLAEAFSYEPAILDFLSQHEVPNLPIVLAINQSNHSFLMKDAGDTLRPILKENYDIPIVKSALYAYAKLQQNCIPLVDSLLSLGIPDFRLSKLPSLFDSFFGDPNPLLVGGLKSAEIKMLQNLHETFANMCRSLDDFGIPETLEQGDFHDDNILIKNGQITLSDFGDAVIAHPFFSIANFLNSAEIHHQLKPSDQNYLAFRDIYLSEWRAYASQDKLHKAFNIAYKLRRFAFALGFKRIKSCPGIEAFPEYDGYLAENLRTLLNSLKIFQQHNQ